MNSYITLAEKVKNHLSCTTEDKQEGKACLNQPCVSKAKVKGEKSIGCVKDHRCARLVLDDSETADGKMDKAA